MSNGMPLMDGVVASDANLEGKTTALSQRAAKVSLSWLSMDALLHSCISTAVGAITYVAINTMGYPILSGVGPNAHLLAGAVLGMLLVARVVLGVVRTAAAAAQIETFFKSCRSLAVLSCAVNESLTVSAGAEQEKKAAVRFRFELVRLLNLAFFSYSAMLKGMKLAVPPTSLRAPDGGAVEADILATVENPTVMVCKMIAALVEQQRAAKRVSNEVCALLMGKVTELVDGYHSSLAMLLAPMPVQLSTYTLFFVGCWTYTVGPTLAMMELADEADFKKMGFFLTIIYTFVLNLFFFGLYEAGNLVEAPLKYALEQVDTDATDLSDELSSLVDDDCSVPVFLPKTPK